MTEGRLESDLPSNGFSGAAIFMVLVDIITYHGLGYLYYPNSGMAIILLLLIPLTALLSIEGSVMASSRLIDVRSAQSFGLFMYFPFLAIYIAAEIGIIRLDATTLLIMSAVFAVLVVALFLANMRTFKREEILTKWK